MRCKLRGGSLVSEAVLFAAILIGLVSLPAPAQTLGMRQSLLRLGLRTTHAKASNTERTAVPRSRTTATNLARTQDLPAPVDFLPAVFYSTGGYAEYGYFDVRSVVVADFNGDHRPDLATSNSCNESEPGWGECSSNGTVAILLGNGDGTFQPAVTYDSGGYTARFLVAADLNGDGNSDLAVVNGGSGTAGVLLGNSDGTFQPVVTYASGLDVWAIAVADLNRDGKPDLVLTGSSSGNVGVLLGNGDGTFQPSVVFDAGDPWPLNVAIADVNRDGKLDLAVSGNLNDTINVLLGNGDGSFQAARTYSSGGVMPRVVAIADVNRDHSSDLIVANIFANWDTEEGSVSVLRGNGDGTFQPAVAYDSGGQAAESVQIADVNGDGKVDLVVGNDCDPECGSGGIIGVLLGNSTGEFEKPVQFLWGSSVFYVAAGDLNGDGKPDLIAVTPDPNNAGTLAVLINNTDIPLRSTTTVVTTSGSPSLVGQLVTITARVTSARGAIPDGELVIFYDGRSPLASVALVSGTASYATSSLSAKRHIIRASYGGDATFKPSTGYVTQVVSKYATATTLTSAPNPSNYGQPVTFTATVTPSGPYAPTGKVRYLDGTLRIGSATLSGGVATITRSKLAVGTHTITAQYLSDSYNAKSTSLVVNQVVQ